MEQHPRLGIRGKFFLGLVLAVAVVEVIGLRLLVWPRGAGQGETKNGGATARSSVAPAPKEVSRFVEHFCPLTSAGVTTSTQVVPSPIRGWSQLQDSVQCFTLDFPSDWRMEDSEAAVHLWTPDTDGVKKEGGYWDADLTLIKPYQTAADEQAEYEDFEKRVGVEGGSSGLLAGPWERTVNGDGSASIKLSQERKSFNGRGEFTLLLQSAPGDATRKALLGKIADTFTAQ